MRHPITLDLGATLRFGVKPYTLDEDETKTYLTDADISMTFKIRNGEHAYIATADVEYEDGLFMVHLAPSETATFYQHRAYYYVMDAVYPSGDVFRWLEGPVYVKPVGGRSGY